MSRKAESATVTFSVNLPQGVIKEYFDGLAKVEAARHPVPVSTGATFTQWAEMLSAFAPIITAGYSMLGTEKKSDSMPFTVRTRSEHQSGMQTGKHGSELRSKEMEETPEVIISFVQKSSECPETKTTSSDQTEKSSESVPVTSSVTKDSSTEHKEKSSSDTTRMKACDESKETTDTKQRRPSYDEGQSGLQFNLDGLNFGAGGLTDMMKMFAPMLQSMTSGLEVASKTQTESTTDDTTSKSETSTKMTEEKTKSEGMTSEICDTM